MHIYEDLNDQEKAKMRRMSLWLLLSANVLFVALILSYGASAWHELKSISGTDTKLQIAVVGEGKTFAVPDIAKIQAAIVTRGESLTTVQDANGKKTTTLVDYLKGHGVTEKDIKSTGYNISPQYSYPRPCPLYSVCPQVEDQTPKIIGYEIRASYEITVRERDRAGDIVAGMVGAGANEVSGISFVIEKPDEFKEKARRDAIRDAEGKARALATNLGKHVAKIVSFTEEGGYFPPIYYKGMAAESSSGGGVAASPTLPPGENEITVRVTITYEFK